MLLRYEAILLLRRTSELSCERSTGFDEGRFADTRVLPGDQRIRPGGMILSRRCLRHGRQAAIRLMFNSRLEPLAICGSPRHKATYLLKMVRFTESPGALSVRCISLRDGAQVLHVGSWVFRIAGSSVILTMEVIVALTSISTVSYTHLTLPTKRIV